MKTIVIIFLLLPFTAYSQDYSTIEKRLEELNIHLSDNPEDIVIYKDRAAIFNELGKTDRALTDYNIYLEFFPFDQEVRFSRALLFYRNSRFIEAITDLHYLLYRPYHQNTSSVYFAKPKNLEGSTKIFTIKGHNKSLYFYYLGLCHFELMDFEASENALDSAIAIDSLNPDFYNSRALLYEQLNSPQKVIEDYNKVLEIHPNYSLAKYNLSKILRATGKNEEANLLLSQTAKEPGFSYAQAELGLIYFNQKEYRKAALAYEKAILFEPDNIDYRLNKAKALMHLNMLEEASEVLLNVLKIERESEQAYFNLAVIAQKQNKHAEAIEYLDIALFYHPGYQNSYYNRAVAYYNLKNYHQACSDLKQAIKLGFVAEKKMIETLCE